MLSKILLMLMLILFCLPEVNVELPHTARAFFGNFVFFESVM